jgi:HEAT repeat protein
LRVAKKIVVLGDKSVLQELEPWLNKEDRHVRGNAAFIFASLGDDRGFEVIKGTLFDRTARPPAQWIGVIEGSEESIRASLPLQQIASDRYYAAHLFGDLKDARAVPILVPLLSDKEVRDIIPWSLGELGDKSAIPPFIEMLGNNSPDMQILAIYALEKLKAKEALPQLRALLDDNERIHFEGLGTVAEAARAAIASF